MRTNLGFLSAEKQNLHRNVKTKVNLTHRWRCGYTLYWNVTPNVRTTHRCPYFELSYMDFKQGIANVFYSAIINHLADRIEMSERQMTVVSRETKLNFKFYERTRIAHCQQRKHYQKCPNIPSIFSNFHVKNDFKSQNIFLSKFKSLFLYP